MDRTSGERLSFSIPVPSLSKEEKQAISRILLDFQNLVFLRVDLNIRAKSCLLNPSRRTYSFLLGTLIFNVGKN